MLITNQINLGPSVLRCGYDTSLQMRISTLWKASFCGVFRCLQDQSKFSEILHQSLLPAAGPCGLQKSNAMSVQSSIFERASVDHDLGSLEEGSDTGSNSAEAWPSCQVATWQWNLHCEAFGIWQFILMQRPALVIAFFMPISCGFFARRRSFEKRFR